MRATRLKKFTARGEFIYASLDDTEAYNLATGNDLGSALMGYYLEGGYNLLPLIAKQKLVVFARYENYDTNQDTVTVGTDDSIGRAIYMIDPLTGARIWWV